MLYVRARLRYLAALGFPALASPMFACSGGGTGGVTPTPTAMPSTTEAGTGTTTAADTATAAPTATATVSATASGTAAPVAVATWIPENDPRPKPKAGAHRMPSCPNGLVCMPQPASLDGAEAAPAPYASCAAEPVMPPDSGAMAGPVHRTFQAETTKQERAKNPNACCYAWVRLCPGGRPLRGVEGDILAAATRRSDWLAAIGDLDLGDLSAPERAAAAAHYAREAAFEHASVAAFSRAALGLLAHGSPAELVAETHAAAIDEVEHARAAFALASAFAGEPRGPSKLDVTGQTPLPQSLAELAVETFLDACLGETVAALALREAAGGAEKRQIASLLDRIAGDEERHAELAWRTVAWALREGGAPVREALSAAMEAVREEGSPPPSGSRADLRALGILGDGSLEQVRARALREVVLPCAAALLASGERSARRPSAGQILREA